ncbi:hypothetical protein [Radiobacillus deserti]|uniref:Uncharacterized protein n=1 Tax=Radiobacillus deserti TaxID=2594883 RepID=A0A516KIF7_9BACI|nr:hypothetical protein [Radiobacillus deserti]QDP41178.1 hypothetical protein FN924_13870 [Radiobacillus deserti]
MFFIKKKSTYLLLVVLGFVFFLVGCQQEEKVFNEAVTIDNFDSIILGDPENGESGTTYKEVISLFDGKKQVTTRSIKKMERP